MPRDDGSYPQLVPSFHSASHTPTPFLRVTLIAITNRENVPFLAKWYVLSCGFSLADARWRDSLWRLWNAVFYQLDAVAQCAVRQRSMNICVRFGIISIRCSGGGGGGIRLPLGSRSHAIFIHVWMLDKKVTVSRKDDFL
jgi:hypothetical protein